MTFHRIAAAVLAASLSTAALAMPVQTFLTKAYALQQKGPLALFSSDLKLLTEQAKSDMKQIRAEHAAAKAAGRPRAFCLPEPRAKLTDKDVMSAMEAVPPAQRARTDTRDALRAYVTRRFPCR